MRLGGDTQRDEYDRRQGKPEWKIMIPVSWLWRKLKETKAKILKGGSK